MKASGTGADLCSLRNLIESKDLLSCNVPCHSRVYLILDNRANIDDDTVYAWPATVRRLQEVGRVWPFTTCDRVSNTMTCISDFLIVNRSEAKKEKNKTKQNVAPKATTTTTTE